MPTFAQKPTIPSLVHRRELSVRSELLPERQRVRTSHQEQARDWLKSPHCNLPLKHPAWSKLTTLHQHSVWKGLTQYLGCYPIDRVAHIALANFNTDLPFAQRHDFLNISLSTLLGEDFAVRIASGELAEPTEPRDSFDEALDQATARMLWKSWQAYQAHELADYERGMADAGNRQELSIEDVISYTVKRIPDEPSYRLETMPGYSDAYLESLNRKGSIRWTSKMPPENLFFLFLKNDRLRRIIFGKYANASFTIKDVRAKFEQG
jgi:hypothetical protein